MGLGAVLQNVLLIGMFGTPLVLAFGLLLSGAPSAERVRWFVGLAALTVALCALGLLPFVEQPVAFEITWLPEAGPMRLSLGTTSLYAAAATALAAVVALGLAAPEAPLSVHGGALALLALSAGNGAFLADHFLLRYIALEVVGLCIAVAPLLQGRERDRLGHAGWVYLLLRLGDAGLLVAILLLGVQTGTFEIGPALAAGMALPPSIQAWIAGGFFLAVAVKVGLWPFHTWVASGERLQRGTHTWLYATLMPNLGLYLLYRVAPLGAATRALQLMLLGAGVLAAILALLAMLRVASRARYAARITALVVAALWCAALLAGGDVAWWGLLVLSFARLPFFLPLPSPVAEAREEPLEHALDRGLVRIAVWLQQRVELGFLEEGLAATARFLVTLAEQLYEVVEQQGLEGLLRGLVRRTLQSSRKVQGWHSGRLRINLWWLVLCLILAIGFVLLY